MKMDLFPSSGHILTWAQSKETGPVSEIFKMSWDETVKGTRFVVFTDY
jgi:hypothetical protein